MIVLTRSFSVRVCTYFLSGSKFDMYRKKKILKTFTFFTLCQILTGRENIYKKKNQND